MIGSVIGAIGNIVGGFMNKESAEDAQYATQQNLNAQMEMQKAFAKQGIRWRVEDARKAGIHPLYALGANTASYTPQSVAFQGDSSLGNAFAAAGQDIGRAINSTRTGAERVDAFTKSMQAIQLESAGVDLQIKKTMLASQIQRNIANATPPGPGIVPEAKKPEDRPQLYIDGTKIHTDPGTSPAKSWEDALGDDITSPGFWPNAYGIAKTHLARMSAADWLRLGASISPAGLAKYNWRAIPKRWN